MKSQSLALEEIVAQFEQFYGMPPPLVLASPFEWIIWENVAYLVDDERRAAVFGRLRQEVGIEPEAILNCPTPALVEIISAGGMQPERRAEKLRASAKIAEEVGLDKLNGLLRDATRRAKGVLKRFPGIGGPGADKILLFTRSAFTLAPESNAVRVLARLGFVEEDADYSRMYRSLVSTLEPLLPHNFDWLIRAHQLLRLHGQSLCKRSTPRCEICPVNGECLWYRRSRAI